MKKISLKYDIMVLGDDNVIIPKEEIITTSMPDKIEPYQPDKAKNSDEEYIKSEYEKLLNEKGIQVLKSMNDERTNRILNILKKYHDVDSFIITDNSTKKIVLRHLLPFDKELSVKETIDAGLLAYQNGEYDKSIEKILRILGTKYPKPFVYGRLGLAYLKKGEISTAIEYLKIATSLGDKDEKRYDFSELIASLEGKIDKEDRKPFIRMREQDFSDKSKKHEEIENIDEITSYILENKLDVETACQQLGMSYEQVDTLRLEYAKRYYLQGCCTKGDQFLKSVEQNKNKTKHTIKLLEELKRNKRVYTNRNDNTSMPLQLTMQPKKNN